jgi:hypothetical protein
MEKRSLTGRIGFVEEPQVELEPPKASICLRSQYPGNLIVIGKVTGQRYVFNGGGSTLKVAADDVPEFLKKTVGGNSCCGSGVKPLPLFTVV